MDIYVLMQRCQANNKSCNVAIKAFASQDLAFNALNNLMTELELFKGLKLAYNLLLADWSRRNIENANYSEALEKEQSRLMDVLKLSQYIERHGISLESDLPSYYIFDVEFDNHT